MLIGLMFLFFGGYYLLKILVPGFDVELSWSIVLPIIFIVLGITNLIKFKKFDVFNIAIIVLGAIYLLEGFNVISNVNNGVVGAVILIGIGVTIISSSIKFKKLRKTRSNSKINTGELSTYNGIFSGIEEKINTNDFKGTNIYAIFGAVELDLRNSKINEDVVINAYSVFGGVDLMLPAGVNVVIKSGCAFGGVENKVNNEHNDKNKTIYINATAIFGGVDLK